MGSHKDNHKCYMGKCCCCIDLKTGAKIISIASLVLNIIDICFTVTGAIHGSEIELGNTTTGSEYERVNTTTDIDYVCLNTTTGSEYEWANAIAILIHVFASIMLFLGVHKEKRNFIRVWIYVSIGRIVMALIGVVIITIICAPWIAVTIWTWIVIIYITILIVFAYFVVVVRSYAITFSEGTGATI